MAERRSGIDLLYCSGGWAVVYGEQLLGLYTSRDEAIRGAREESHRVLAERSVTGDPPDPVAFPRLRSRRQRRQRTFAGSVKE